MLEAQRLDGVQVRAQGMVEIWMGDHYGGAIPNICTRFYREMHDMMEYVDFVVLSW